MTMTSTEPLVEPQVEIRSGDGYQVADVNYPKRIVTVIAMPYERPTQVPFGGGIVTEVVSRGAFEGIERRAGQIRANRDHSWDKPVGKIVALHPSRKEGLVTEVRISPTRLGEETLALCDDDVLSASVGFALLRRDDGKVCEDAEVWERSRLVRRLNRLWLDHLALVPNPAYPDATVMSVRSAQEPRAGDAMPNREWIALQELKTQRDALNARWAR